ncbi:ABC transporter permease subunit [Paenibacillus albiflavus]|uniref:ABC transporter permease subunit n=1 Tax=Paenibacillus albiflavus TaxID=2545760 RepID=A0A4R4EKR0_9BACL|nr:ABC transporter permease subunit [Paenibacillus albiflavus]TCZ78885.1 ABC transporter permease subunit [Paenibacillus albiflavus]
MSKYRIPYLLAWLLMILMIVVAISGKWLMPHGISPEDQLFYIDHPNPNLHTKISPPFGPNRLYWLGTEVRGFDMLSLILNGMKYTLGVALVITLLRFIIAIPAGLYSGVTGKGRSLLASLNWISTSLPPLLFIVPPLVIIYSALRIDIGLAANHPNQIIFLLIFVIMVTFIGSFPLAYQFSERARFYSEKLYMESSSLLGASVGFRIRKHLLPNLRTEMFYTFVTEFIQVLFLMGQLAIVNIFIGGGELLKWDDGIVIPLTTTGEWFSLITFGLPKLRIYPWITLAPMGFFVACLCILQFFLYQVKKGPLRNSR